MAISLNKKQTPAKGEYKGYTGSSIYAGYFSEEYLTDWDNVDSLNTFEKMRRSDSQIKMILRAVKNPIRSAKFAHFSEAENDADQKIVDFLDWAWFGNPLFRFSQWLGEALTFLDFGFSIHEKKFALYEHKDFGPVHTIAGLGYRKQTTIESWDVQGRKGLQGVRQLAFGDTVDGQGDVYLPVDSLSLLTNEREGDNWEGVSLLRSCYGAWLRKNLFLKLVAIGIEKAAIGTPIGKYPRGAESTEDKDEFISTLRNFAMHQSSFIVTPQNYEVDIVKIPFDADKVKAAIEYEDVQIAKTILFQFLELGTNSGSGSYALGSDLSDFALSALQFVGDYIAESMDEINRDLVRWNFGDIDAMPKCKCSGINQKAGKELSEILEKIVSAQIVRPDDRLEAHIREVYNLPMAETSREDEAKEQIAKAPGESVPAKPEATKQPDPVDDIDDTPEADEDPDKVSKPAEFAETASGYFRELSQYENAVCLSEVKGAMEGEKQKLLTFIKGELGNLKARAIRGAAALLKRSSGRERVKAAREFDLPVKKYEAGLYRQYLQGAEAGMRTAKRDFTVKLSEFAETDVLQFLPEHVKEALKLQASYQANVHGQEIERIITTGIMSGVEAELSDEAITEQVSADLDAYIESSRVETAAGTATSQNINRGRNAWFFDKENIKSIQAFQYSAILDSRTTDICLSLDGQIARPHDPALSRLRPPNHHNCRSILVPVTVNEPKPELTGISVNPANPALVDRYKGKASPDLAKINKSRNL